VPVSGNRWGKGKEDMGTGTTLLYSLLRQVCIGLY
jgi:hypothetical protein